jgi:5-formyltetrahydrofolate cyclo-ligase
MSNFPASNGPLAALPGLDHPLARRAKAELRKRLRALRNSIPASACTKRSELIVARLREEPSVLAAKSVALFYPMEDRHEVDLRPLDEALRARGVVVAYPSVDPETREMVFREAPLSDLEEQGLGFAEPCAERPMVSEFSVIVVPALGVAPNGHRLGYGAGFYDRALPAFSGATKIVVAYDFQVLVEIPVTEGDIACDIVLTDARRFPE